ncbi:GNAT family N-acetyltransferase [Legionella pneumophila]|uniref:GNAT family N-acetyltransferase n=1 Tax=Legionella pneumophila TaxID=446 RepID=UPI00276AE2E7|nr:GNAT family protein [Legionella sp.]
MKPILINLPMPIITPRLLIRPTQVNDGKAVNAAILESYEELHRFMDWAKTKPSVEDSEEQARLAAANWILKRNEEPWLQLFIYDKTTGEFIGGTGYHHIIWEVPSVETGYWIRSSRAKEGLMTEAINAITQYAFKQLGVKRIAITCDLDNSRSQMIPERLNYTLEATLKSNRRKPITGEISDTLVYAKYDLDNLPNLNVNWPTE